MKEQTLIKKIEDRANKFKLRALKSPSDRKRHDPVRQDEQRWIWIASNQLGWSFAKIGSVFDRDPRSTKRAVETYKTAEQAAQQKPYEETAHKQKMRDLARNLIDEISLPWIVDSIIVELKPRRFSLDRGGFLISVGQEGEIGVESSIKGKGEIDHLHQALRTHLETGGFSQVLDEIGNWANKVANNLLECHIFFTLVKEELEKSYGVSIPMKDEGQPGFATWFPITICADAIEQARGSDHFRDFPYTYEGLNLRFGAFLVYFGVPNEDLGAIKNAHIKLRAGYAAHLQAQRIAGQRGDLYQTEAEIKQQLENFIDMERLPGQCELCS